jgi:hypothetical protein
VANQYPQCPQGGGRSQQDTEEHREDVRDRKEDMRDDMHDNR